MFSSDYCQELFKPDSSCWNNIYLHDTLSGSSFDSSIFKFSILVIFHRYLLLISFFITIVKKCSNVAVGVVKEAYHFVITQ